jgi:hypothetical protein
MMTRTRVWLYRLIGVAGLLLGAASFILMPLAGAEYNGSFLKQAVYSVVTCLVSIAGFILSFASVCWSRKKLTPQRLNPWQDRIYWPKD